ncbi:MAG: replication-associated recombination protein A [SAR202 cluster bacterium]|jgi:putative ATPase|nr:replication-associated recombination protein A [SAR202 cluster bacterium]
MTLFDFNASSQLLSHGPLAHRMRPMNLNDFIGHSDIIGDNSIIKNALENNQLFSMIFWGPPGCGKTTLAKLIGNTDNYIFSEMSAVVSGVADIKKQLSNAQKSLSMYSKRSVLFIDEIHRFNKSQQDVILPYVENGTIILLGATTENPSFEIISPLLSRCKLFVFNQLKVEDLKLIVENALNNTDKGIGSLKAEIDADALDLLINISGGDARILLNTLEIAALYSKPNKDLQRLITKPIIQNANQYPSYNYDKSGDYHYNYISALIKSIRGSDPNASLYWLARILDSGEDPVFVSRRLVILASEDIGMADPNALLLAIAGQQAVSLIGMPECRINLSQVVVYLSTAPKSNSVYTAINEAMSDAKYTFKEEVPLHLRNPVTETMKDLGYGKGYKYAHDYPDNFAQMDNLPDKVKDKKYYFPSNQGFELKIIERLKKLWGDKYFNK